MVSLKKKVKEFKDYWFGDVDVIKHYIYGDWPEKKKISSVSIIPSIRRNGAWFSEILPETIEIIVKELCEKKKYRLKVVYSSIAYQSYMFNIRQQRILKQKLTEIIANEPMYYDENAHVEKDDDYGIL